MTDTNSRAENLDSSFKRRFQALTGNSPLRWQERLFRDHFVKNDLPSVIDLPTGLGKTMVMAIWLIARSISSKLPRRLIYVVDRRTVVDQATDIAENFAYLLAPEDTKKYQEIAKRKPNLVEQKKQFADTWCALRNGPGVADAGLTISTLRGQLADNREWSQDPSRLAIIIGTVDLIGSGLLFTGYRSSYKRRPLEAGLLGQDSLLVLDEAHLSRPFEQLITSISGFQQAHGNPMQVIRMSATSKAGLDEAPFKLEDADLTPHVSDCDGRLVPNPAVVRFEAKKRLTIITLGEKDKLTDQLASHAIKLAENNSLQGKRIVVFVRKPEFAKSVANAIREHVFEAVDDSDAKPKKIKHKPYINSVEVLTGTMRGLERDELVEKPVLKRFLAGDESPDFEDNKKPVFLVATSAGSDGLDLRAADHMVSDTTTIDSFIQRLGRVNRRGRGDAQIHLLAEPAKMEKDGKPKKLEGLELAIANSLDLLRDIKDGDVSPKNIAQLKRTVWNTIPKEEQGADKPRSRYDLACAPVPTMVELTDILLDAWSMTSITEPMPGRPEVGPWLRGIDDDLPQTTIAWRAELDVPGFGDLDLDEIEEWFDTHRILTHETLSVPTSVAAKWLIDRWAKLPESLRSQLENRPVIVDRAGTTVIPLKRLIDQLSRKGADSTTTICYADVILPALFGGIERRIGLLDAGAPTISTDEDKFCTDVADVRGERYREKVEIPEDGEAVSTALDTNAAKPVKKARYALELESDDNKTVLLVSYVARREKQEIGSKPQPLEEHVKAVRKVTDRIIRALQLAADDTIRIAFQLAADHHDHGKARERWQRLLVLPKGFSKPDKPMGKSGGEMKRDPRGYRHEFGSIREFTDAFHAGKLKDDSGKPISQDVFDLAIHLIATHHGRGRPHFPKGGFDPVCEFTAIA